MILAGEATQPSDGVEQSRRTEYVRRYGELRTQRSPFDAPWREIATYVKPRRSRFFTHERQSAGTKKEFNIINNGPTRAVDINAAGMEGGITSPTRPWFRLTTANKMLAEVQSVKAWLGHCEDRMRQVMQGSDLYLKLHELYVDLGAFCTAVLHIEEDVRRVLKAYVFPIGSYVLATGADGTVDTCMRLLQMTARQMVKEFGKDKVSRRVREAYRRKTEDWFEVLHVIEPNADYTEGQLGAKGKAYSSCWMETSLGMDEDGFLREAGFHEKPFLGVRWSTTGEDVYGNGPGMDAIGDCKTLQLLERKALQLAEKMADPPMVGPSSMRDEPVDLQPGGINYEDPSAPGRGFRPAIELPAQAIPAIQDQIERVETRIDKTFKTDVWLMLAQLEEGQKTATEVLELKAEKMLQLGPMLERFQSEGLRPMIERIFGIMVRNGIVPPAPPELQGQELTIEYESTLAQAQKLAGIQGVQELWRFANTVGASKPDALDLVNEDKMVQEFAEMVGTSPDLVRSDDEVQAIRQQRAQAQAAAAKMQQIQQAAETAKTASQADTEGDNALTRMMNANGLPGA